MENHLQLAQSFVVAVRHISIHSQLPEVTIERRGHVGEDIWCVKHWDRCLDKDGNWHEERMPSSRSDEFIAQTRFTLEECFEMAKEAFFDLKEEMGIYGGQLFSYLHPADEQEIKVPTKWTLAKDIEKENHDSNT